MAPPIPIQKAACNVLGRFLAAHVRDLQVSYEWPEADQDLPPMGLTILQVGEPKDEQIQINASNYVKVDARTGLYTWEILARYVDLQLDVWAQYEAERSGIVAELDEVMHLGELYTLGEGDPVRDGLLLPLKFGIDGFRGTIDYTFSGASFPQDPGKVRAAEWRATFNGTAGMILSVQATSPRIAKIRAALATDGLSSETLTIVEASD